MAAILPCQRPGCEHRTVTGRPTASYRITVDAVARPLVIAIVGIDGAGKSTQARRLADWLHRRGTPAHALNNPGGRLRLDRIARRLGARDAASVLGRYGYLVVEVAVRWLMIARALVWSRLTGRIAVMDRYTVCEYAAIRARGDPGERVARGLYRVFPLPDLVVFLAATPEEAARRIRRRGTDSESVSYLAALDAAYRGLPEATDFRVVDANGPPDQVQWALREVVTPYVERRVSGGAVT